MFATDSRVDGPAERPGRQSLTGIVVAIEQHRRQMAHLLEGLDGLERAVVPALVTDLAHRLRLDDARLERLAEKLDEYVPHILQDHQRQETSDAHALRPPP